MAALRWGLPVLIPILLLETVAMLRGEASAWSGVWLRAFWVLVTLGGCWLIRPVAVNRAAGAWPWTAGLVLTVGLASAAIYGITGSQWAAWILLGAGYALLMAAYFALVDGRRRSRKILIALLFSVFAGATAAAMGQIEARFSDEEFFVAIEAGVLGLLWLALALAAHLQGAANLRGIRIRSRIVSRRAVIVLLLALLIPLAGSTVAAYQRSFYAPVAPAFPGVSSESPFLCGRVEPSGETYDGGAVFERLLEQVAANPKKGAPELGMLALGTGSAERAQAFRSLLLAEAREGRFTSPAHSIKSTQYEAALRVYYFARVHQAFPDLFSAEELEILRGWFADINRRALTVEWVDWMYALAFAKRPEGPYENQEIGAGLLALLETSGLAADELHSANRAYLDRSLRGWDSRFRNSDDAFSYQKDWINNAFFQALDTGKPEGAQQALSFEWLLLQSLPDGSPLQYNHVTRPSMAGAAYLGAALLGDPRYLWLAGRMLAAAEAEQTTISAQPGIEQPIALAGQPPDWGSCLLYGDTGLPNKMGPLAPDKIVFRDGWLNDSAYLLLNLRFTGWHRYKATNTVSLLYQGGTLAAERTDAPPFSWLPKGRSIFRDKRVPRENLNGLLVEQTGLASVLSQLTGLGSAWAQDPPYYAEVLAFRPGKALDFAHTRIDGWRGWRHDRRITFHHEGGPVVIEDEAWGPAQARAALAWNLGDVIEEVNGVRYRLRGPDQPAEMVLVPLGEAGAGQLMPDERRVLYSSDTSGHLRVATVFLFGDWVGAEVSIDQSANSIWIGRAGQQVSVPLEQ